MRVLVVSDVYPPFYQGGYELLCGDVVARLESWGHEVHVLTSRYGLGGPSATGREFRVLGFREDAIATMLVREAQDNRWTREVLARVRPDVVSVWNAGGLAKSILYTLQHSGTPVTYYVHDDWLVRQFAHDRWLCLWKPESSVGLKRTAKRLVGWRPIRRLADRISPIGGVLGIAHVAFVSAHRRAEAVAAGFPLAAAPVIYGGVDPEQFFPAPRAGGPLPMRMLFVGRLVPEKGVDVVVRALAGLLRRRPRSATLTLVGAPRDPGDETALRELVRDLDLGEAVRFLGHLRRAEIPAIYRGHDCFVLGSRGAEGFPLAVLEAMASGLVVVGTVTGGTSELLAEGQTGLTCPVADPEAMSFQMERALADRELRARLVTAALARVRSDFTIARVAERVEDFLLDAASDRLEMCR